MKKKRKLPKLNVNMDKGILCIIAYTLAQGIFSTVLIVKSMLSYQLAEAVARLELLFIVLSIAAVIGSYGMLVRKKWGPTVIQWCYMLLIPLTAFSIYYSREAGAKLIAMSLFDIGIAALVIIYLSEKRITKFLREA